MGRKFTPIIGLAVVVALAMAAVFGAMSLANPAWAQSFEGTAPMKLDGPASIDIYTDDPYTVDLTEYFMDGTGEGAIDSYSFTDDPGSFVTTPIGGAALVVPEAPIPSTFKREVTVTGMTRGIATLTVMAVDGIDTDDSEEAGSSVTEDDLEVEIEFVIRNSTLTTASFDPADEDEVKMLAVTTYTNTDEVVNVADYFDEGTGSGEIVEYDAALVTPGESTMVTAEIDEDEDDETLDNMVIISGVALTVAGMPILVELTAMQKGDATVDVMTQLMVTVKPETEATVNEDNVIGIQSLQLTDDGKTERIPLEGDMPVFSAGDGKAGQIIRYTASSDETNVVIAYVENSELVITARGAGSANVTVVAVDGKTSVLNPDIQFVVLVDEEPVIPPTPEKHVTLAMADFEFATRSTKPGSNTRYDLRFSVPAAVDTLVDELEVEFEDFGVPSSIATTSVAMQVDDSAGSHQDRSFSPEDVAVNGEKLVIYIGDMYTRDDTQEDFTISAGSNVTLTLRQSAGVSNPTEAGDYGPVFEIAGGVLDEVDFDGHDGLTLTVRRVISLSEEDGGLGEVVTATGKGFENGTSLTFFVDMPRDKDGDIDYKGTRNGDVDLGEDVLCVVPVISGSHIGACEFTVTHPTFRGGDNFIRAYDGDGNLPSYGPNFMNNDQKFELKRSISATPDGGSPGETILIQVVDFPINQAIMNVQLGGQTVCGSGPKHANADREAGIPASCGGVADQTGSDNFAIVIPNWVRAGRQELRVVGSDKKAATTNVDLIGPQIAITPKTVLANQRISLVGTGFSPGAIYREC